MGYLDVKIKSNYHSLLSQKSSFSNLHLNFHNQLLTVNTFLKLL